MASAWAVLAKCRVSKDNNGIIFKKDSGREGISGLRMGRSLNFPLFYIYSSRCLLGIILFGSKNASAVNTGVNSSNFLSKALNRYLYSGIMYCSAPPEPSWVTANYICPWHIPLKTDLFFRLLVPRTDFSPLCLIDSNGSDKVMRTE